MTVKALMPDTWLPKVFRLARWLGRGSTGKHCSCLVLLGSERGSTSSHDIYPDAVRHI